MAVTIPNDAIQTSAVAGGAGAAPADVLAPLKALLTGVGVLPSDADLSGNNSAWLVTGTPPSVSILEAGATAASKGWAALIGALGGAAAIGGAASDFWKNELTGASRVAAVGGLGLVVVAAILAIAYIVVGDIRGRTQGAAALYEARQAIALKFLDETFVASQANVTPPAAGPPGPAGPAGPAGPPAPVPDVGPLIDAVTAASAAAQWQLALTASAVARQSADVTVGGRSGVLCGIQEVGDVTQLAVRYSDDDTTEWLARGAQATRRHLLAA